MPEFGTGLVFPGSENVISLGGFWFNIEGAGVSQADRITMDIYVLTYKQSVACMERGSRVCVGGTRRLRLAMRGVTPSKDDVPFRAQAAGVEGLSPEGMLRDLSRC